MRLLAIYSLAIVWIISGLSPIFFQTALGYELLASVHIKGVLATTIIYLASGWDILLGLMLLSQCKLRLACGLQVLTIILYSFLLSFIAPHYWLHPFGVLTKNLPIIVLILWIYRLEKKALRAK